jgi:cytidylate kinase
LDQSPKKLVIAIDGPAGAGKSTVAREVAARLGYLHIDSGAMYRALTVKILRLGIDIYDAELVMELAEHTVVDLLPNEGGQENRVILDGVDITDQIREPAVSAAVPVVSTYPKVRSGLLAQQRLLAARGGVVMDGRDIGTVVLPDADVKVFLTATLTERAVRRQREMAARGVGSNPESVIAEIAARDTADSSRAISPLVQAADAVLIDTTQIPIQDVVEHLISICSQKVCSLA